MEKKNKELAGAARGGEITEGKALTKHESSPATPACHINLTDPRSQRINQLVLDKLITMGKAGVDITSVSNQYLAKTLGINRSELTKRGGWKGLIRLLRANFIEDLHRIVDKEAARPGKISMEFHANVSFCLRFYYQLILLDLVFDCCRTIRPMVEAFFLLVYERRQTDFRWQLMQLLYDWRDEDPSRASFEKTYRMRIIRLVGKFAKPRLEGTVLWTM